MLQVLLDSGWQSITYRQNTDSTPRLALESAGHVERSRRPRLLHRKCDPTTRSATRSATRFPIAHDQKLAGRRLYFSRLTWHPASYWKSNPYLTAPSPARTTCCIRNGARRPRTCSVTAIRIAWAEPTRKTIACSSGRRGNQPRPWTFSCA